MEGELEFTLKNSYAFVSVSTKFASRAENIMKHEGFSLRYMIRKKKFPGIEK